MHRRVSFSHKHLQLEDIALYYSDSETALRLFFSNRNDKFTDRFANYTSDEVFNELNNRVDELNHTSSLSLLAAIEAFFYIDYLHRNYKRLKDPISKQFKEIHKDKKSNPSLQEDILAAWENNFNNFSNIISELKGAFKYRHWLAHGRYLTPKWGRQKYDFESVYQLADNIFNNFPFVGIKNMDDK